MRNIMGMQAFQRDSIDLITRQRQRLRAQLNRGCRALDFYAGFYMEGSKDGKLCEDRDQIHARTGAKCEIDKFRLMVPVHDDDNVALELARLERGEHLIPVVEDPARRLDRPSILGHRTRLYHRAADRKSTRLNSRHSC